MRILIADAFEQSGRDALDALGCEVRFSPKLKDEALVDEIEAFRPDVLVVRSTKVSETALAAGALKLVVRAGAGYNTIDVTAASRRGIYVSNCPGKNSIAVAELAFALILALDRQIADNVIALRQGQWNKSGFSKARGLFGCTLGLIGLGQIGREVAVRARAFGLPVVAWSRSLTPEAAQALGVTRMESPEEVAAASQIVSVHVALNAQTRGLLGEPFFAAMRPGAFFINTARAEVVDQAALARGIESKGLRAGLDVFANEPATGTGDFADAITKLPGVYGTHHIGASTEQAQEAIAAETVRIVGTFKDTGKVPNVVNLAIRTPATCRLIVRHRDRPGVLAHVFEQLRAAAINVQETENVIFAGAEAAVARINLDGRPSDAALGLIGSGHPDVLSVQLVTI
jgi:D-3-phosphoglycerate dehydrogenase